MTSRPLRKADGIAKHHSNFNRRTFLHGVGACLALPAFESIVVPSADAATLTTNGYAVTATGAPLRMAFLYIPNGVIQDAWWPSGGRVDFEFNETMKPLESLKQYVQVLGGLDHLNATAGPDGAGDHARANGTFLTGVRVRKTAGADIHAGVSIDQVAAGQAGHLTRFSSLELSCEPARRSGNCDNGYSCAYQFNLAWRSPTTPLAPEVNPRLVFERLFGGGSHEQRTQNFKLRQQQARSILDFVMTDAVKLQAKLSGRDRDKLDEYLTSVREIEKRLERMEKLGVPQNPGVELPTANPADFKQHMRLMFSMIALAFETDSTRIATLLLAHDGSNRSFKEIGVSEGHHELSHHQGNREKIDKIAKIDAFYMEQFAWFLSKLQQSKDIDGQSILHNSMIVYGGGNADGNRHSHDNLPVILAGAGGGSLTPGRFIRHGGRPMSNLYLSMIDRMGVEGIERFGDSTGRLTDI
ncbi:MAG: DUF1552 domain-containing protein [Pirellulales bacterium]|nr:DUF1552 domain-containing protein [Pirellulales bacterium]